jgi:hypothetical protein
MSKSEMQIKTDTIMASILEANAVRVFENHAEQVPTQEERILDAEAGSCDMFHLEMSQDANKEAERKTNSRIYKENPKQITSSTTIKNILDAHPNAAAFFSAHGLDVGFLSDASMLGTAMTICKSMGNVYVLDGLMQDLKKYIEVKASDRGT